MRGEKKGEEGGSTQSLTREQHRRTLTRILADSYLLADTPSVTRDDFRLEKKRKGQGGRKTVK